ncbi:MAG: BMP family ABC transporter substrate-binding protein [Oscillospiraceae bacterium]|nr:BMP family ABC transporter substrate-binding protein [Oscillospiraceae bacterium]
MAYQDYVKAQKSAEKQYRQAIARGVYPYLTALEDLLRSGSEEGRVPLGQIEIPVSMIAGTASAERTKAFASNFMPLLDYDTEFGAKWSALYDSVQEIGVNEPIKVLEYMQRFYVIEGNKRVSVSRYNGAVSIEAQVTRVLPRANDSVEYRIYADFLDFYRIAGIYEIQMSQTGAFSRLLAAIPADSGTEKAPLWSESLRQDVRFLYAVFESYFISRGGQRMPVTAGDAFLHFIEIYGFAAVRGQSSAELHRAIDRIWAEFRVLADSSPSSYILEPTEDSHRIALMKMLPIGSTVLKIAFLYPKDPERSAWSYNHELGRLYLNDALGGAIETTAFVAEAAEAEDVIRNLAETGFRMIFTTSPVFHAASMRMAVAFPDVIIMNCSMNSAYKQVRTYFLRIYEAKFITGIIAGSMTENERIGYIADYPVLGTPASICAFALGVKLVNPRAMVYLDWSTLENHDPADYFREKQIDLISDRDLSAPGSPDHDFGLYGLYGGQSFRLAAPVWNWGSLYEEMVRSVLIGAWKNDANRNETHALNYYWGMSSGAIEVACSSRLPSGTQKLVALMQRQIAKGSFHPFTGVIYAQDGSCIAQPGVTLTPEQIVRADWFPDNVVGRIPDASELAAPFRPFTEQHGLSALPPLPETVRRQPES